MMMYLYKKNTFNVKKQCNLKQLEKSLSCVSGVCLKNSLSEKMPKQLCCNYSLFCLISKRLLKAQRVTPRNDVLFYKLPLFSFFQRSTFVGSAWSFGFFIPATTANDLLLRKIFYPRFYPSHLFCILILEKEPVFPFLMFSAKQGHYWYHFYNVFGMTRSLTGD